MPVNPAIPLGIIACDVLEFEVKARLQRLGLQSRALRFLEMGKHDTPDILRKDLQAVIDELEQLGCRRLLFVYGLCSNSILGLTAKRAEMVFPRAHDCITLFLGSRERYAEIHKREPGTYWFTPGWCRGQRVPGADYFDRLEARYREKFEDEEDVEYLMEMEREKYAHYNVAAYTDLGDGPVEESRSQTVEAAKALEMEYRNHEGDDGLLVRLLAGPWDAEEFLVIPPGKTARYAPDSRVIRCGDCPGCAND
ncbi:MAG: DUF1638 domain-containing protein [Oceanipulchritudo sp.]